jgi:hypothetical protein
MGIQRSREADNSIEGKIKVGYNNKMQALDLGINSKLFRL